MRPSDTYLDSLALDTGFRKETLEKVLRLGEVFADISRHPLLSEVLVLKGGTALNLCFGKPARLSVDLDFNYVGAEARDEMLQDRPRVEGAVHQIARAQGYQVQQSRDEYEGRKLFLHYFSAAGNPDRIELDLNYLHRVPVIPGEDRVLWQPANIDKPKAAVVSLEELCAGKLCALLDRSMPRDIYDVMRFPIVAKAVLGTPRFRALFIAVAGTLNHPIHSYGRERLERVTEQVVQTQLHPMLSGTDRPTAAILKERAWEITAPLLDLTEAEREYTDKIQVGDFAPELLIPGEPEILDRLRRHPALLWKAANAKKHAKKPRGR